MYIKYYYYICIIILKQEVMVKKFLIVKHLSFSNYPSYYCVKDGNLDNGLYHGSKFKGKQYDSKEECEKDISILFEIELKYYGLDEHRQVVFSIEEIYVKI